MLHCLLLILCRIALFTARTLMYIIVNWIFADISKWILKNLTSGEDGVELSRTGTNHTLQTICQCMCHFMAQLCNNVLAWLQIAILNSKIDASVCLCAKFDQFLPVRSHFDTKRPINSVRIATFQSANFGPLLFAFYCPLLFYENKIKNE